MVAFKLTGKKKRQVWVKILLNKKNENQNEGVKREVSENL